MPPCIPMKDEGSKVFQKAIEELERQMRAEYIDAGAPYGYTKEGLERWIAEREAEGTKP